MIVPNNCDDFTFNDSQGEDKPMYEDKLSSLRHEVEVAKRAVEDAKDWLASAERDLEDYLDLEFNQ